MDSQFESSFAEIAYAALQEKAPKLMHNIIGFQLLDHNEVFTKAFAMFALKINGEFYYIPVFWISGKLKPIELIYKKTTDKFMPLTERWIDLLLKPEMASLGLPVKDPEHVSRPNLEIFSTPPRTGMTVSGSYEGKTGGDYNSMMDILEKWAKYSSLEKKSILPKILERSPGFVKTAFIKSMVNHKALMQAVYEYSDWELIKEACVSPGPDELERRLTRKLKEEEKGKVQIFVKSANSQEEISAINEDKAARTLIEKGFAVQDGRPVHSQVYDVQQFSTYTTPNENSIYNVIDSQGELRKLAICPAFKDLNPRQESYGFDYMLGRKKHKNALIIDLESGIFSFSDPSKIFAQIHPKKDEIISKIQSTSLRVLDGKPGKEYCILIPRPGRIEMSSPFRIKEIHRDKEGLVRYVAMVDFRPITIMVSNKLGPGFSNQSGLVTVTKDCKLFPVTYSHNDSIRFGNSASLRAALEDSGVNKLNVINEGADRYTIATLGHSVSGLDKKSVLENLCLIHGVSGNDAVNILSKAQSDKTASVFVKHAAQYGPVPIPAIPNPSQIPSSYGPTEEFGLEQYQQVPPIGSRDGYQVRPGDSTLSYETAGVPEDYNLDVQKAIQAAMTGSTEIFDAGALMSMSQIEDVSDLVQYYLPDLENALDKLGRILFLYWWKFDKFKDQYTIDELAETEDNLRNLFKSLGKLVHKIKSKGRTVASLS